MRTEKDAFGEVQVPDDKYYGAQTQRAVENFRIGSETFPRQFIHAHTLVKKAAALVNRQMGHLEDILAQAIITAADEILAGMHDEHFPLVIWQSGSGTQTNMNVNEVIANRANELLGHKLGAKSPVHPNDHVNMSQSTNDTFPTSMHISTVTALKGQLMPPLKRLSLALQEKSTAFGDIIKIGRTHLQDATPLTLGQELSGYVFQLQQGYEMLLAALDQLYELPIGGTAVGTGLNAPKGFDDRMVAEIGRLTGEPFIKARNKFAALAAHDTLLNTSGVLKTLATALMKIANDIRWLGSGPRCGLGELVLPPNEPGSSIMPGKVNPTQCEMLTMIACRVIGNDTTITLANSQGNFELNVYKPLIAYTILQSVNLLADAMASFERNCIRGIEPNRKRISEYLDNSLMLVTALNRHIGYDKAAQIASKAWKEDKTLRQAALELGFLTSQQFDEWVRPENMIHPE